MILGGLYQMRMQKNSITSKREKNVRNVRTLNALRYGRHRAIDNWIDEGFEIGSKKIISLHVCVRVRFAVSILWFHS